MFQGKLGNSPQQLEGQHRAAKLFANHEPSENNHLTGGNNRLEAF